jgi:hypothetical protein
MAGGRLESDVRAHGGVLGSRMDWRDRDERRDESALAWYRSYLLVS